MAVDTRRRYIVHGATGRFFDDDTLHHVPSGPYGDVTGDGDGGLADGYEFVVVPSAAEKPINIERERYAPSAPSKRKPATAAQRREYREKVAEMQAKYGTAATDRDDWLMLDALIEEINAGLVVEVDKRAVRQRYIAAKKAAT